MLGLNTGLLRGSKFGRISRGSLTPKHLPHGWYKGRGARPIGKLDNKARLRVDRAKLINFHVPDLTGFELKPYVSYNSPKVVCPPMRVPPEFEALQRKALEQIKEEAILEKNHRLKMRQLIAEAHRKASLKVSEQKTEERMKKLESGHQDDSVSWSWDMMYADKFLPEKNGEPLRRAEVEGRLKTKRFNAQTNSRKRAEEIALKKREEAAKRKKFIKPFNKNEIRWSKKFLKPTRKGGALAKVTGKYESRINRQAKRDDEQRSEFEKTSLRNMNMFKSFQTLGTPQTKLEPKPQSKPRAKPQAKVEPPKMGKSSRNPKQGSSLEQT